MFGLHDSFVLTRDDGCDTHNRVHAQQEREGRTCGAYLGGTVDDDC